jgi:hypothetical protein
MDRIYHYTTAQNQISLATDCILEFKHNRKVVQTQIQKFCDCAYRLLRYNNLHSRISLCRCFKSGCNNLVFTVDSSLVRDLLANCPLVGVLLIQWNSSTGNPGFCICYDTHMIAAFTHVNTTKTVQAALRFMFTNNRLLTKVDCSDVFLMCASKTSSIRSYCYLTSAYLTTEPETTVTWLPQCNTRSVRHSTED